MGISRDSRHKRRSTGGQFPIHQKKRKYELGRPPANTKLGSRLVRKVRCRGGNLKYRALKLDTGNFAWSTQRMSKLTRITNVVYNASSNELVRTNTLVKNTIVTVDAAPYKLWFQNQYGFDISKLKDSAEYESVPREARVSPEMVEQIVSGKVLACISSRPGQTGRCDGYLLEEAELKFYKRKLDKKKKKKKV